MSALLLLVAAALPGAANSASAPPAAGASRARAAEALSEPDERFAERIVVAPVRPSVFEGAQVISLYGYPGIPVMGALGAYAPQRAAEEVARIAAAFDALNGERGAVPALHLIVAVAQPLPQADGSYLARISPEVLASYVDVAREHGLMLFLDVQVGWSDPLAAVQRLSSTLAEPFVHLALDPEFATRSRGAPPGEVIGSLDAEEVNAVQEHLATLVREHALPPKLLVLHQFLARMLPQPERFASLPEVELTIDMDGYGSAFAKLQNYHAYALAPYAERAGIKLFFDWDAPLLAPERLQGLERPPDLVIYQ